MSIPKASRVSGFVCLGPLMVNFGGGLKWPAAQYLPWRWRYWRSLLMVYVYTPHREVIDWHLWLGRDG